MTNATNGSAEGKAPSGSLAGQESDEDAASWPEGHYNLRLYIAGQTAKSAAAIANLRRLCEDHLADCHTVEVIDLSKDPGRAAADQIVAYSQEECCDPDLCAGNLDAADDYTCLVGSLIAGATSTTGHGNATCCDLCDGEDGTMWNEILGACVPCPWGYNESSL